MIFPRHLCVTLTIGCLLAEAVTAQDTTTGGATAAPGGASSAFGTPAPNVPGTGTGGATPGTGGAIPGTGGVTPGAGSSSAFGANPPGTGTGTGAGVKKPGGSPNGTLPNGATGTETGTNGNATGAASTFGEGPAGAKKPADAEATYTIPGGYGKPAQQFTAGEGRLARPKFRYTGSISFGYDDNIFQSPTNSTSPDTEVTVLASPGTPDRTEVGIGPNGEVQTVVIKGTSPKTRKVVILGGQGQERIGSFLNRANVGLDVQFASRKTLFTFDIRTGADLYWDRPGKDVDYTGSLALMYLRRLTPRLQFTANVNASYQTQPDLSQVNTSTRQAGSFLSGGAKLDLTYRFTPRVSAVASVSYNGVRYVETAQQFGDSNTLTLGGELRYLFSPRLTLATEARYSMVTYTTNTARDAHTVFLLLGGDVTLSRRFSSTVRLGGSMRSFDSGGDSTTSPYGEVTLGYQLAKATMIHLNGRYGFEDPPDANSKLLSLRSGLSLVQSFSPRLRGTLGVSYVRQTTTSSAVSTAAGTVPETSDTTNTVDSTIGFEFNLNRNWILNANYSYSREFGTVAFREYYRNRAFVGAQYDF